MHGICPTRMIDMQFKTIAQCINCSKIANAGIIEVDELSHIRESATADEISGKLKEITTSFAVQADCSPTGLNRAAHTAVALDKLVSKYQLGSLAYYH